MHAPAIVSILSAGLLAATAAAGFSGPAISDLVLRYSGSLAIAAAVPVLAAPVGFKSVLKRQPEEEEEDGEGQEEQNDGGEEDEGGDEGNDEDGEGNNDEDEDGGNANDESGDQGDDDGDNEANPISQAPPKSTTKTAAATPSFAPVSTTKAAATPSFAPVSTPKAASTAPVNTPSFAPVSTPKAASSGPTNTPSFAPVSTPASSAAANSPSFAPVSTPKSSVANAAASGGLSLPFTAGQPPASGANPVVTPAPVAGGAAAGNGQQTNVESISGGFIAFEPAFGGSGGFTSTKPDLVLPPITLGVPPQ